MTDASKSELKRLATVDPLTVAEKLYQALNKCTELKIDIDRINTANRKLRAALELVRDRGNHSCNIEYGNNVGTEHCVLCAVTAALR